MFFLLLDTTFNTTLIRHNDVGMLAGELINFGCCKLPGADFVFEQHVKLTIRSSFGLW